MTNIYEGRAMAEAASRRPLTAEAPVRSIWDLWWAKWHWEDFFPSTSVFPNQFPSTGAPIKWKNRKKKLIVFPLGLHNKPSGCGASVASVAGKFN
jgi:hypothetical protein